MRYLSLKQSLGRKYATETKIFKHLDSFLYAEHMDLTVASFSTWCCTREHLTPTVRRSWMRITRNFCLYRRRTEPECFVPDQSQFPAHHQPIKPHIFSDSEIIRLLDSVKLLESGNNSPLRREGFQVALVLLYTTGLRRGELLRLTVADYDSKEHTLLIRESKFHKSRLIPLSMDGWTEIEAYLTTRRKRRFPVNAESPLIWSKNGRTGHYSGVGLGTTFHSLFQSAAIFSMGGQRPRIHDFRHNFAVQALLRWYREGEDVQAKLPMLSTYMGHVSIVSTQYYLHFIEELVNSASDRFAKKYSALVTVSNRGGVR
jgi:integrase